MTPPHTLRVEVKNAVGMPLPNARTSVVVRRGREWSESKGEAPAPVKHSLREGFIQIEVTAAAGEYDGDRVLLDFDVGSFRWESTNPACRVTEQNGVATLEVPLGRLRFAPVVQLPDTQIVRPPFNPGGVLVADYGYRTVHLRSENCRALKRPATGDPDKVGWDRFEWTEVKVDLAERGNWLVLEYGEPAGLRHLIGVWAPHTFPGSIPTVVVQLTPNTSPPRYPADGLPFTGMYPYGCVAYEGRTPVSKKDQTFRLGDCGQSYVELPSNRTIVGYKTLYQIYCARPDVFDGPNGPIIITPSPAALKNFDPKGEAVLRSPFTNRDGLGRLIAEVLRFLWAQKLTLPVATGRRRLRFSPPATTVINSRPATEAVGFPARSSTVVLTHSAGIAALLPLVSHAPNATPTGPFPSALFGGRNDYCSQSWNAIWLIDGVGQPGRQFSPVQGGQTATALRGWLKAASTRRVVAVYTPSGLDPAAAPGIVGAVTRKSGSGGWIEEGFEQNVAWLRVSDNYLRVPGTASIPGIVPQFGSASSDSHNKIYEFGVGYAARYDQR